MCFFACCRLRKISAVHGSREELSYGQPDNTEKARRRVYPAHFGIPRRQRLCGDCAEKINMVCSYLSEKESVLPASGLLWLNALRERQQEITKNNSEKGLS